MIALRIFCKIIEVKKLFLDSISGYKVWNDGV